MQQVDDGAVVWVGKIGQPVVYFVVELPGGVGAVIGCDFTNEAEIEMNTEDAIKRGKVVSEHVDEDIKIITMLPPNWDRDATLAAVDMWADNFIETMTREMRQGGFNVN